MVGPLDEFERCWPWLEAALERHAYRHNGVVWPTHRKEDVWQAIASGRNLFWPGENCALVTFFRSNPSGLKDHHNWLTGGDDLHEILALVTATEEYGRQNGCHRQTGVGRRGWLRFFEGYKETGTYKQKILR